MILFILSLTYYKLKYALQNIDVNLVVVVSQCLHLEKYFRLLHFSFDWVMIHIFSIFKAAI